MADEPTNFPKAGDDKPVSLRNSAYPRFDFAYAQTLKEKSPDVWALGGNIRGNQQFELLSRVLRQGGKPANRAEEKAVRLREAWAARHYEDHQVPGVVAQIKWLVVGKLGEEKMKALINAEKEKDRGQGPGAEERVAPPESAGDGGHAAPDGMLVRTAVVLGVRREPRPTKANQDRMLVVVDAVASTEDIDSHDSILACDWDQDGRLKRYESNPVLLWQHGRDPAQRPAIGHAENVRCERASAGKAQGAYREPGGPPPPLTGRELRFSAVFDDTTEFDREIAAKFEKGVLRAFSVGWKAGEADVQIIDGKEIVIFSKNELREISPVNIPSNAFALAGGVGRTQRAITAAAREMARAAGGPVAMSEVLARVVASSQERAATPNHQISPSETPVASTAHGPGDIPMTQKMIDLPEGAVRAVKGGGGTCSVTCPNCDKSFDMSMKALPMPEDKTAELAQARAALTEQTALVTAEQKRAEGLETRLAETSARLTTMLLDSAIREIDARVGKKIEPSERDEEIDLARTFLADTTPDPESLNADKVPTRTLGQKKLAARLAKIDGRRDLGLLGPAITTTTTLTEPSTQVRAITDTTATPVATNGGFTRGGEAAASLLDEAPAAA